MNQIRRLAGKLRRRTEAMLQRRLRQRRTQHLYGPAQVNLADHEVMVTVMVRDAAWFLGPFIRHHQALGARHVLVIDNGSTDATIEIARAFSDVTIMRNTLPARDNESHFRREISQAVAQGGWILFADADELVELPAPLEALTGYCNAAGHTAVVGQMLDRFSDQDQERLRRLDYAESVAAMDLYSLHAVQTMAYDDPANTLRYFLKDNICADPGVTLKSGGMRHELFGEMPLLSKHSLVRNRADIGIMSHPHCASGVRVADVTLLLHHYKLAGDWMARDRISVRDGHWGHGEDQQRLRAADAEGGPRLEVAHPRRWNRIADLQRDGFLYASPGFAARFPGS